MYLRSSEISLLSVPRPFYGQEGWNANERAAIAEMHIQLSLARYGSPLISSPRTVVYLTWRGHCDRCEGDLHLLQRGSPPDSTVTPGAGVSGVQPADERLNVPQIQDGDTVCFNRCVCIRTPPFEAPSHARYPPYAHVSLSPPRSLFAACLAFRLLETTR